MKLRCPTCGHVPPATSAKERDARRIAEQALRGIGATLDGPYCIECHKAGRGDVALVEVPEA